ncbi:MAG TPA: lysylphosphatidylglycerol synthase transmembrane domain-containing protein [Candidatus Saccharimonadales bacterium]|nr:lysylphosphatidylglycerol synthase transmembrane domain-containing protein [Candidatus Saccharimonadales bacterium]
MKLGKVQKTILKITVSVVLFGFLLYKLHTKDLLKSLLLLDIRYIPLIVLLLVLNYIVSSIRWKNLLSIYENTDHVSVWYLTSLYFIGSFFNNFMPTSIGGDVFKVYKLGAKIKNNAHGFSSTFMERFTGIIALVLISSISLIKLLGILGVVLFVGFWVAALIGFLSLKLLSTKVKMLEKLYSSLMQYKGKTKVLTIAFLSSFIVQFLAIFTQYFIFVALGIKLPFFYSMFVFPVITLASFFIPSLNGVGVQDTLYVQMLKTVAVAPALALSASIIYHLSRLAVSLVGGLLYAAGKAD